MAARGSQALARRLSLPTLDGFLLARHRAIDRALEAAIHAGTVSQVIEVAAGLSPRGWRFSQRYGAKIHYVEADLPSMARRKRMLLDRGGLLGAHHEVVDFDALAETGPRSLAHLTAKLDGSRGTAIITEGLINYFPRNIMTTLWARFAASLGSFPHGLYVSDIHLQSLADHWGPRLLVGLGSKLFSSGLHLHFRSDADAEAGLRNAGFASARVSTPPPAAGRGGVMDPAGARTVRVIEATTVRPEP